MRWRVRDCWSPPVDSVGVTVTGEGRHSARVGWADRTAARLGALLPGVIVLVAAALRLRHLDRSLNIDEVRSVLFATLDWGTLLRHLFLYELNMAPYYLALRAWLVLGHSEVAVRALSVAVAILTLPVVWAIGVRFFTRRVAFIGILLLALSPLHIKHAENARGYELAVLLVALSSYFLLESVRRPTRWSQVAYVATSVLAVYTQFHAGLVLVGQWLTLPLLLRTAPDRRPWMAWPGIIGMILLSLVPAVWFAVARDIGQLDWITSPGWAEIMDVLRALTGERWALMIVFALLCAAALVVRDSARTSDEALTVFLVGWCLTPLLLTLAISVFKPIFLERYLIVTLPALVLLAGVGMQHIRWTAVRLVILMLIVVLSVKPLAAQFRTPTSTEGYEQWRRATRLILSAARPGDAVAFQVPEVRVAFDYYAAQFAQGRYVPPAVYPPDGYLLSPSLYLEMGRREVDPVLDRLGDAYQRVWVVFSHDEFADDRLVMSRYITSRLAQDYPTGREYTFRGVRVVLFAR